MEKDNSAYLLLMRDAFGKIQDFTVGMSFDQFSTDSKTQSAVIMQLQVIGELAKRMPEEIKDAIAIPWKEMAGLRDIVAHDYFKLDLVSVWETVEKHIPEVKTRVSEFIEKSK